MLTSACVACGEWHRIDGQLESFLSHSEECKARVYVSDKRMGCGFAPPRTIYDIGLPRPVTKCNGWDALTFKVLRARISRCASPAELWGVFDKTWAAGQDARRFGRMSVCTDDDDYMMRTEYYKLRYIFDGLYVREEAVRRK